MLLSPWPTKLLAVEPRVPSASLVPYGKIWLGLLHLWESQDCSLYTNALVYSPPSAPDASAWPGLVGRTSASMILSAGPNF